jgi:flagellar hook-associated protein 3 FlgL
MRVTQQMVNRQFMQNLQKNMQAMGKYQQQIASGTKIEKPSDDPAGAVQSLAYQSSLADIEQYQKNANDGISWAEATDDALGEVTNILQRIRELTVQGSNDTNNEADRKSIAAEIRTLQEQLGSAANTTIGDRYLFSGTDLQHPPYENGTLQEANETSMQWRVGKGTTITAGVTASAVFGFTAAGKNMFETIASVADTLEAGSNPKDLLKNIDQQLDNVLAQRTNVGVKQNLLESAVNRLDETNALTQKMLSDRAGVDMAQVFSDLSAQETIMKAALSAGAKIIQPTLVDFLR